MLTNLLTLQIAVYTYLFPHVYWGGGKLGWRVVVAVVVVCVHGGGGGGRNTTPTITRYILPVNLKGGRQNIDLARGGVGAWEHGWGC